MTNLILWQNSTNLSIHVYVTGEAAIRGVVNCPKMV